MEGKLSREALQLYAAQYYRHVEAFPKHLRVLAPAQKARSAKSWWKTWRKRKSRAPHPKLWRDFAGDAGRKMKKTSVCPALPGTQTVVETFREIVGDRPVAEAVAALSPYEAQVAEIATTKIDGLKKFYGVDSAKGLAYFTVTRLRIGSTARRGGTGWRSTRRATRKRSWATTHEALDALWGAAGRGALRARVGMARLGNGKTERN